MKRQGSRQFEATAGGRGVAAAFASFMTSARGRAVRIALGAGLIVAGVFVGPPFGYVMAAAGILPVAMGALNACALAPSAPAGAADDHFEGDMK